MSSHSHGASQGRPKGEKSRHAAESLAHQEAITMPLLQGLLQWKDFQEIVIHLMDETLAALCGSHASFTWKASFRADRPEVKHVGRLSEMLSSLQKVGLLLKAEKRQLLQRSVNFL
ncbi:hypothetical protein T08_16273 [Trichinella sp. T8]|nr:hypothetical protein T08_16273 [Trichinella sp. T8]